MKPILLFAFPALLCGKLSAEPLRIETTLVDGDALSGATYQSHNQKVVQNRRGIFMVHLRSRNEAAASASPASSAATTAAPGTTTP